MKVIVNIPLKASREYLDDFDENTIPDIGDKFDEDYTVANKTIHGDICTLDLR